MTTRLKIAIKELPLRPREATEAEYAAIFGGCIGKGESCSKSEECCAGLVCQKLIPLTKGNCTQSIVPGGNSPSRPELF